MDTAKVPRHPDASGVAAILDSPEVIALIAEIEALRWTGRPGFGVRALLGACIVKSLYAIPTWSRTAALIADHQGLREALGDAPSQWACYRFAVKLAKNREPLQVCLDNLAAALRERLPGMGENIAIDASDLPAWANGQRFLYKDGPERKTYSDPDASWGHRSAISTRKGGGFYGYKIQMAACATTGLPLAWRVETARHHESLFVAPLLDAVRARGFEPATCALDKGYDAIRIYDECEARGCAPVIPLKGAKDNIIWPVTDTPTRHNPRIQRHTAEFKSLYRGRSAVEREFGRLKHHYGLVLRVRGLPKVQLHADLVMLARLAQALSRARVIPLAA
jgi:hypothetical protein